MKLRHCWALIFCCLSTLVDAQTQTFFRDTLVHVMDMNNQSLYNAWGGGLNSAVFAEMDLNNDGIMDLVAFSSTNNRIVPLINKGIYKTSSYVYAPEYVSKFPNDLDGWIKSYDYDNDGDMDLFSYYNASIRCYRNDINLGQGLKFTLVVPQLYTHYGTFPTNIYVSRVNMPALSDVDNDGDMDVLAFSISGSWVEYHKNYVMDSTGSPNGFLMYNIPQCWGYFALKSSYNTADLPPIPACPLWPANPSNTNSQIEEKKHAGSVLCAFDADGDGDKDILNGDVLSPNVLFLQNCGNPDSSYVCSQDSAFPSYNVPATMLDVAAPFYFDADNDGNKDFVVSNFFDTGEDYKNVMLYRNTTNNQTNVFNYTTNEWLVNEMVEVGTGAHPAFFDVNADGKKDLLIANEYRTDAGVLKGKIAYYQNTSAGSNYCYTFMTDDFASLSTSGIIGLSLSFADMDGDGDDDMIIGDASGNLHLFTNNAVLGGFAVFSLTTPNYLGINVGSNATPQMIDVDHDGQIDILIGERNGNINYYRNNGNFTFSFITANFGGVNVKKVNMFAGFSVPYLFDNGNGYELLVGSYSGYLYHYNNIDGNLNGNFTLVDSMFQGIYEPQRSFPAANDVDGDGKYDLVIGNACGGVVLYSQNSVLSVNDNSTNNSLQFDVFPNPVAVEFQMSIKEFNPTHKYQVKITDIIGREIFSSAITTNIMDVNLSNFKSGVYICNVIENNSISSKKIIKL
ncbi:MAG: T9SS type A sorting domain-containing protein [Bacteroidota bacterium]